MAPAKKTKKKLLKGRDAHGNPIALQSTSVEGFDADDPIKKAQRRGKAQRGSMGKETLKPS